MQLEAAKSVDVRNDMTVVQNRIERAVDLARSSLREARRSVRALRPRSLRAGTLSAALEDLIRRMPDGADLKAQFHVEGEQRAIPAELEEGLFRIAQESLTNAIKHANARNFKATLRISAQNISLSIADDGMGFDPKVEHDGLGLMGMKERAEQMGGQFILHSKAGEGTEIAVALGSPTDVEASKGDAHV